MKKQRRKGEGRTQRTLGSFRKQWEEAVFKREVFGGQGCLNRARAGKMLIYENVSSI